MDNRYALYSSLNMSYHDAVSVLKDAGEGTVAAIDASRKIVSILLDAELTPLQTRAALVRAWAEIQATGKISKSPVREPN